MNTLNSKPGGHAAIQRRGAKQDRPKWQSQVISMLFVITLSLIFGFFVQEGLRWLS